MKKIPKLSIVFGIAALLSLALFAGLIVLLKTVDVRAVGPMDSYVGLASFNDECYALFGRSEGFAWFTKILGGITLLVAGGLVGGYLIFFVANKTKIRQIPSVFWVLLAALALLGASYLLFEVVVINYRPILEDGALAPSFPSSHTLLAVAVFGIVLPLVWKIRAKPLKISLFVVSILLAVLSVVGRLLSGVHWTTDIIGGVLWGLFFTFGFSAVCCFLSAQRKAEDEKAE